MKRNKLHPRLCIPSSSFFDRPPYYEGYLEKMRKIIKDNGGYNLRMRHAFDWANQPKVITFSAGTASIESIEKVLKEEISQWVRVDNVSNWKKPLGNGLTSS